MRRDRTVYIKQILECIQRIESYTAGGRKAFFSDTKTQDAVIRNLEIIGQAVKDYGIEELMAVESDVPWNQIAGMRNILAHQYLGVDLHLTWDVVERDLPPLKEKVAAIARNMDDASRR